MFPFTDNSSDGSRQSSNQPHSHSSSLYDFSQPHHSMSLTLDNEDVYRGIDISSPMFAINGNSHQQAQSLALDDFDSTFGQRMKLEPSMAFHAYQSYTGTQTNKVELPSLSSVSSLASISALASLSPMAVPEPVITLPPSPSFIEPYSSFRSRSSPSSLISAITSLLIEHRIDYDYVSEKAKFTVSFLCPKFSFLSITFIIRLYQSQADSGLTVCEGQRREGCVIGFNKAWELVVGRMKERGLVSQELSHPLSSLSSLSSSPSSSSSQSLPSHSLSSPSSLAPSLSLHLDDQAFELLKALVTGGDCSQQCDALRVLGLSLSQPSSINAHYLPSLLSLMHDCLTQDVAASESESQSLNEERATQLTRILSLLSHTTSITDTALITNFIAPLIELLSSVLADLTLTRLRIVRFIAETLDSLTSHHAAVIRDCIDEDDLAVLARCSLVKDAQVARLAQQVAMRLTVAQ